MLLQVKTKRTQPFFNRSVAKSIKNANSIVSNPEIQILVDRIMAQGFVEQKANPLNLIDWGRTKYRPSQSQNRIKIQNRISMKKAEDEKLRPKVKPIKRYAGSADKQNKDQSLSYKEHYKEISTSLKNKIKNADEESQDEFIENKDNQDTSSEGIKYYNSIKKYTHLLSYLSDKIGEKQASKITKKCPPSQKTFHSALNSVKNDGCSNKMRITSKTVVLGNLQNQIKIDSIIKKWRPANRTEIKLKTSEGSYSSGIRLKSRQLMNATSKVTSLRQSQQLNEETSFEKQQFSQITKTK